MSVDLFHLSVVVDVAYTETAELAALKALTAPPGASDAARLDELVAKASCGPLQSLLMVIGEQIEAMSYDLDRLYDDNDPAVVHL